MKMAENKPNSRYRKQFLNKRCKTPANISVVDQTKLLEDHGSNEAGGEY
jgi:hypothetical protein